MGKFYLKLAKSRKASQVLGSSRKKMGDLQRQIPLTGAHKIDIQHIKQRQEGEFVRRVVVWRDDASPSGMFRHAWLTPKFMYSGRLRGKKLDSAGEGRLFLSDGFAPPQ